jgi:helix-turn-helix protein
MSLLNDKHALLPAHESHERIPREYTLIIPGRIIRMPDLTLVEKGLLAIVDGLHHNGDGCHATNQYLALRLGISTREITRIVASLESAGYIIARHESAPDRIGGRVRYLIPTGQIPATTGELPEGMDKSSIPPRENDDESGGYGQIVHTSSTDRRGGIDKTSPVSGPTQARASHELEYEHEVEHEVYIEGERRMRACAHEAAAAAAAPCINAPDSDPTGRVRTSRASPESQEFEETVALLLLPIEEGGAGGDSESMARELGRARSPEELRHWIAQAKKRDADNVFAWIFAAVVKRGDAPPPSYLRAQKEAYREAMSGGPLADLLPAPSLDRHPPNPSIPKAAAAKRPPPMDDIARQQLEMKQIRAEHQAREAAGGR